LIIKSSGICLADGLSQAETNVSVLSLLCPFN